MSERHERALRGILGRFLAVGAIILGLIGMHSLLLADPANHGSAPTVAAAASDVLRSSAAVAASASAADVPVAALGALLSSQGGEHADLITACVLALLLTAVLLLAPDRRLLARFTAGSARSHPRHWLAWPPALRTSPAVLAISRT